MNPTDRVFKTDPAQLARREHGLSKHLSITHLVSPTVYETHSGLLATTLALEGVTFDTAENAVLNQYKRTWHRALTALDERFCVYVTLHRHQESLELTGHFPNAFLKELDERYHAQFQGRALYANDLYLTVVYQGLLPGKKWNWLDKLSHSAMKEAREQLRQEQLKTLSEAIQRLTTSLSDFKPMILGSEDQSLGYSEVMRFLGLFVNAGQPFAYPLSASYTPFGHTFAETYQNAHGYPHGHLAQFLGRHYLHFGDAIQFQGATADETRFAHLLSIKHYGASTASIMLDPLLHLEGDFILTHLFAFEAKEKVLNLIHRQSRRLENVNDPAYSQREAFQTATDQLASGEIAMGYHANFLMLLETQKAALDKKVAAAIKCYAEAGMVAVRETLGQEPAFWAQIPTNLPYAARLSLITSENFVDFAPLHNYRTGYKNANHLGSAVTLLETPSKTPYFFNYHVKGTPDNPAKGHAFLIGGNNSGKTVLLSFLDAQMARYGGCTYFFDRDRGAEIYLRASGGVYSILSPDFPAETQFNPLLLEDTPVNRSFNHELLQQLCKEAGEDALPADLSESLKQCIDYAYDQLAIEHRTLSHATQILPINFPRWAALKRWLLGGQYAYLFDNPNDKLQLTGKMGFDMTHFLDKEPPAVRTALMMYLFHRIELSMTGQLVSLVLDEGWQYFLDPYWSGKLRSWLPTLRKKNAHVVMATQSPSTVLQSPLSSLWLDNIATQIYFANPQAQEDEYLTGFKLTSSEFEVIRQNSPSSRLFIVKQERDSTLCRLNLGHLPDILAVLSGNTAMVHLLDRLRAEHGDDPNVWLPLFQAQRLNLRKGENDES